MERIPQVHNCIFWETNRNFSNQMYFKNPRNVFVDVSNNNIITNNNIEK